jgi:hypothetical protein
MVSAPPSPRSGAAGIGCWAGEKILLPPRRQAIFLASCAQMLELADTVRQQRDAVCLCRPQMFDDFWETHFSAFGFGQKLCGNCKNL